MAVMARPTQFLHLNAILCAEFLGEGIHGFAKCLRDCITLVCAGMRTGLGKCIPIDLKLLLRRACLHGYTAFCCARL